MHNHSRLHLAHSGLNPVDNIILEHRQENDESEGYCPDEVCIPYDTTLYEPLDEYDRDGTYMDAFSSS